MANLKVRNSYPAIKNALNYFYYLKGTESDLDNLFKVLNGSGFKNFLQNFFTKSADCISSMRAYPMYKPSSLYFTSSEKPIILGNKEWEDCKAFTVTSQSAKVVGSYDFSDGESFIDYEPFTSIQLYLPYIEVIDLPVNEIRGGKLELKYALDFATGMVTVVVEITKNNNTYQIATKTAKIGIDIAWGTTNVTENIKSVLSTVASTAISVVALSITGGASGAGDAVKIASKVGVATSLAKGTLSVSNSLQIRYNRGGSASISSGLIMPSHPYLIIKKPKLVPVNESDYARTYGKPLYESRVLAQLSGYTVVDEIHLTGLPDAYDAEINEIENLLKQGVHL